MTEKINDLFNINFELLTVSNEIQACFENKEEPSDDLLKKESELLLDLSKNIDSCGGYLSFLKSQVNRFEAEIEALENKKKRTKNLIERVKQYILEVVKNTPEKKIHGQTMTASIRTSKFVQIINELAIDKKYYKEKITHTISKEWIEEAIKAGEAVEGAEIWQKNHLVLK